MNQDALQEMPGCVFGGHNHPETAWNAEAEEYHFPSHRQVFLATKMPMGRELWDTTEIETTEATSFRDSFR